MAMDTITWSRAMKMARRAKNAIAVVEAEALLIERVKVACEAGKQRDDRDVDGKRAGGMERDERRRKREREKEEEEENKKGKEEGGGGSKARVALSE